MPRRHRTQSPKAKASKQITKPLCRNLPRPVPQLSPTVMADPRRARAILIARSKWANGTVLHYCFFGASSRFSVPKVQADAVRDAFAEWKRTGIGLVFQGLNE